MFLNNSQWLQNPICFDSVATLLECLRRNLVTNSKETFGERDQEVLSKRPGL